MNTEQLVLGSDEELALVNAINTATMYASHILCTRNLRQNIKQKMINDGIDKKDKETFLNDIFGDDGLVHADDSICFEEKLSQLAEKSEELSSKFYCYFDKKTEDKPKGQME